MKGYCEVCGKEVEAKVIIKNESYTVCGETVDVEAKVLVCGDCGEELFCEEYDSATVVSAYNEYRRRHKLLLPEEIKEIREKYGLSQRSFARLLNWGDKTIYRYENGAVQDKAHNSLLLFLRRPENMRTYLTENEVVLDEKNRRRLLHTVELLERDSRQRTDKDFLERYFSNIPSEENGFKGFDYDKTCAMVVYFAYKCPELLKTKLMKLLNYSDMIFYKENGVSISGLRYVHLPYGPVPENMDIIMGWMNMDHIVHVDVCFDGVYESHQVVPECSVSEEALSDSEIEVMERIYEKFKDYSSSEISEYSHREKGYKATKQGEIISYAYAKDMRLA